MKQLRILFIAQLGKGVAINVVVKTDLTNLLKTRLGDLRFTLQLVKKFATFLHKTYS